MPTTMLDPATSRAQASTDRAAAMARLRKNRWLPARKRPSSTRAGDSRASRWGSRARISRLVDAWVRMWTSSPICNPWAARANTSIGPPAATAEPTASWSNGPATSRRNRSRSTAAGVSRPNHGTSPGPWLTAEKARVAPSRFSTIHTQADGPMADAMGTTVSWWLAGSSATSPFSTRAPASSGSAAQPSAITAARIERRSGSHTSRHSIGGPQ